MHACNKAISINMLALRFILLLSFLFLETSTMACWIALSFTSLSLAHAVAKSDACSKCTMFSQSKSEPKLSSYMRVHGSYQDPWHVMHGFECWMSTCHEQHTCHKRYGGGALGHDAGLKSQLHAWGGQWTKLSTNLQKEDLAKALVAIFWSHHAPLHSFTKIRSAVVFLFVSVSYACTYST